MIAKGSRTGWAFVVFPVLSLVFGGGALAADQPAAVTLAGGGGSIFSPEPVFDFGEVDNDQEVKHTFKLVNVGTGTLTIKDVKTSCGCTVAEMAKKVLGPGEETEVSATFRLEGKQGKQVKDITVTSDDPQTPIYKLQLTGTAVPAILIEPMFINFGRVVTDEPQTQKMQLKSNKPDLSFNVTSVQCASEEFTTELKTIAEGKEYEVVVTLKGGLAPGMYTGAMNIITDYAKRPTVQTRMSAQVVGAVDVAPTQLTIQAFEGAPPTTQQYMRVSPGRASKFKVLEVIAPLPGITTEITPRGENNYNIRVADIPTSEELDGKELIIKTDLTDSPEIKVPFKVIKPHVPAGAVQGVGQVRSAAPQSVTISPNAGAAKQ